MELWAYYPDNQKMNSRHLRSCFYKLALFQRPGEHREQKRQNFKTKNKTLLPVRAHSSTQS